jgi:hypothetical protein
MLVVAGCSRDNKQPESPEVNGDVSVVDATPVSPDFGEPAEPYDDTGELRTRGDADFATAIDGWWDAVATSTSESDLSTALDRLGESDGTQLDAAAAKRVAWLAETYLVADTTGVGRDKFPDVFGGSISDGAPIYKSVRVLAAGADLGYVEDDRVTSSALVAWVAPDETLSLTYVFFDKTDKVIPEYEVSGWTGSPTIPTPISVGAG